MTPEHVALVRRDYDDNLVPPFSPESPPDWPGARWIGTIDQDDQRLTRHDSLTLQHGDGFGTARLLIRRGQSSRGFVEVPTNGGAVESRRVTAEIEALPRMDLDRTALTEDELPELTVVLCTRDRAEQLKTALPSLLALSYPNLKILVVDNASRSSDSLRYVNSLGDDRVRAVYEPRAGLSCARNRALTEADTEWIAFTDDDVVVDPLWLRGIALGIARSPVSGIVCGVVATGELVSPTQLYFEGRIEWAGAMNSEVFDMADPPAAVPLFPFEVGIYGTGANFAIDRSLAIALGGFNEALGAGAPAGGGEDIDMFVRTIVSGRTLVREASAIVWHRHRTDVVGLSSQMRSYGTGMAAWITSAFEHCDTRSLAVRRLGRAARRLPRVGRMSGPVTSDTILTDAMSSELRRIEVRGMLTGSLIYVRSRLAGRSSRPLRGARMT